jgi:hypothetical protein
MARQIVEGKVAGIWADGDRICVAINKGKADGVRRRDIFAFATMAITDPETGEKLADYAPYTIWAADVRERFSVCLLERLGRGEFDAPGAGLVVGATVRTMTSGDVVAGDGGSRFVP